MGETLMQRRRVEDEGSMVCKLLLLGKKKMTVPNE
jgi:hypothetical protein